MNKKNITILVLLLGFLAFIAAIIMKRDELDKWADSAK